MSMVMVPGLSGRELIDWKSQGLVVRWRRNMATGHLAILFPHEAQAGGSGHRTGALRPAVTYRKRGSVEEVLGAGEACGGHPTCPLLFPPPSVPPNTFITTLLALSWSLMGMV